MTRSQENRIKNSEETSMPDRRVVSRLLGLITFVTALLIPVSAHAAVDLSVSPLTWNIVGLDSNSPASGPEHFPVGARVCSSVATTSVTVNYLWDSANPFINLRPGSPSTIAIPSIAAGACVDAYFEVEVDQVAAAFDTARRYHITATDASGVASTPIPRELFVEHLVSQSRNAITDVKYGPSPASLTSVPAGGAMNLVVGNTYTIQLLGGTATQGYNQFEAFINFPNTIFQILSVSTTYSADDSPYVPGPAPVANDKLYADACLWQNDPNSPSYRSCVGGDFKAGGSTVITTYTIKVISGGGSSQTLDTLLYDFSGSSYHYNADFSSGARIANIIDPTTLTISKNFAPDPTSVGGISALTFIITNPNPGALSGINFSDALPGGMVVAATPGATTNGCGTPTFAPAAAATTLSFSSGTVGAGSTCTVKVNVSVSASGTYSNTSSHLFVDTTDTGKFATDSLTATTAPPAPVPICGLTMASWTVPNGTTANPPDLVGGLPTIKAGDVATATLSAAVPASTAVITSGGHGDSTSWQTNGYKSAGQFIDFTIDTSKYSSVQMSFWVANPSAANGPTSITVTYNSGAGFTGPVLTIANPAAAFTLHTIDFTGLTSTTGVTTFRVSASGAKADTTGASLNYDDMLFTGCSVPLPPTLSKVFSPNPVAVGATSTLTFTVTNPNAGIASSGIQFTDTLPAGLTIVSSSSAQCGGTLTTTAPGTISFTGGSLAASASCTVPVPVTATTAGPHDNVSGFISSTQGGTNSGPSGVATASLVALLPPSIAKGFAPTPILAGGTSILTFTITNPNQNDPLSSVAFSDTFPVAPGAMRIAAIPNVSTSGCGAPVISAAANATSISFSGGTIAAAGTCTVSVAITAPVVGTYNNTSGSVSAVVNGVTVTGNTASASLDVTPAHPSISLLKQVGTSASGPWNTFLATSGGSVFYRFTVENTGDVPLSPVSITDNTLDVSACNASFSGLTLPVAVAANDNHIVTCVVGPIAVVSGSHTNTAHASGTFSGTSYDSANSSATYATTGLTLAKSAAQASFTTVGDTLNYSYLVTNSGFAPLAGPVTVADNKTTVSCPSVNTAGDLDNFLDPGESFTCTATYIITATDVANGSVTNTASATADGVTSPTASKTVSSPAASADVSLVKTLTTAGPFTAGQTISYTLVVANAGPSTATNIVVTDTPSNLSITNVSGSGCAALPCTLASLASGANTTITVTATITAAGAFDNTATATATQTDPNPANNTDSTGNGGIAAASADVSLVKTLTTAGPFTAGQTISYTLVVANAGPSTATNIVVTDTPSNLSITNVRGSGCAALPCTIASLASGANTTITVTATITAAGAFDNTATATATQTDPNPANNSDSTGNGGSTGAQTVDVGITKTASVQSVSVGQSFSYQLVVTNNGPGTATGVTVTDLLPANFSLTSASSTQGSCSGTTTVTCNVGTLVNGAAITVTLTGTVTGQGSLTNTATVSLNESDSVMSNNSSTAAPAIAAVVAAVPTLDESGLLLLAVFLALAGAVALRGRI